MTRFALLALALTGCALTPELGQRLRGGGPELIGGEVNDFARLHGTTDRDQFDETASLQGHDDPRWSDLTFVTNNPRGTTGMLITSYEGSLDDIFQPGERTLTWEDGFSANLCGGRNGEIDYDEGAEEVVIGVTVNGDSTRDVVVRAVVGERFQEAVFTLEAEGFEPVGQ